MYIKMYINMYINIKQMNRSLDSNEIITIKWANGKLLQKIKI